MKIAIPAAVWMLLGLTGAGFLNASMRPMYSDCERWAAKDQAFAISLGVIGGPIGLVTGLAVSGFGYDGWTLARKSCR